MVDRLIERRTHRSPWRHHLPCHMCDIHTHAPMLTATKNHSEALAQSLNWGPEQQEAAKPCV